MEPVSFCNRLIKFLMPITSLSAYYLEFCFQDQLGQQSQLLPRYFVTVSNRPFQAHRRPACSLLCLIYFSLSPRSIQQTGFPSAKYIRVFAKLSGVVLKKRTSSSIVPASGVATFSMAFKSSLLSLICGTASAFSSLAAVSAIVAVHYHCFSDLRN